MSTELARKITEAVLAAPTACQADAAVDALLPAPPDVLARVRALANRVDYWQSVYGGWDAEHERYLDSLIESLHEVVEDVSDNEHAAAALRQGTEAIMTLRKARDDARKALIELGTLAAALEPPKGRA